MNSIVRVVYFLFILVVIYSNVAFQSFSSNDWDPFSSGPTIPQGNVSQVLEELEELRHAFAEAKIAHQQEIEGLKEKFQLQQSEESQKASSSGIISSPDRTEEQPSGQPAPVPLDESPVKEEAEQSQANQFTTANENDNTSVESSVESPAFLDMYNNCNSTRKGEGVIILNYMGLLANNMFEIAYANRLAKELCWKILYRPGWNHELPTPRGQECLTNAMLPSDYRILPQLEPHVQRELALTQEKWTDILEKKHELKYWFAPLKESGKFAMLRHPDFQLSGDATERFLSKVKSKDSTIRVLNLQGFFIHYDWMGPHMSDIRQQLAFNPECCFNTPPEDAVVFHVREFDEPKDGGYIQDYEIYPKLIKHYNWTDRPIWVVCQPKTVNSKVVKAIANAASGNITVLPGNDHYDAMCTVSRARTIVGSAASSYSQMAGLLSGGEFHIPIPKVKRPRVTIKVPHWKYHLVSKNKVDIETYDIPHGNFSIHAY